MKILVCGMYGHMGREVVRLAEAGVRGATLVGGIDPNRPKDASIPCALDFEEAKALFPKGSADCLVDFSHHSCTEALLAYGEWAGIPVILCTTGHTEEELAKIKAASVRIPIFFSANMSLGIALLTELAKKAAASMPEAEIEIIEKHHNRKIDAPSGTALMLYEALHSVRPEATAHLGRSGQGKREKNEIGIHAIRMGNIVGEHEIIIGTPNQTITLKHEAHDRALFAEGAVAAAEYMIGKTPGLYDMRRMLAE